MYVADYGNNKIRQISCSIGKLVLLTYYYLTDIFLGYYMSFGICIQSNITIIPTISPTYNPTFIPTSTPTKSPTTSPTIIAHIYSSNMQVTTIIGNGGTATVDGVGLSAQIYQPHQICIDNNRRIMYITSSGNLNVRRVNMTNFATSTIGNNYTYTTPLRGCSVTSTGDIYIASYTHLTIIPFSNQQRVIPLAGIPSAGKSMLSLKYCD
jgi:hypothetical protein